ncbi:mechanosensitive ion channel protein MscS [Tateyamaria omphalii]|uniref:DUF3772 domain-containing protein n=1 Tax=Tateyamaria omphalii TaxID=299262 RepID=UPI0016726BF8|nr:DUF3772 domain-containing protein [Tateyamaria omphalii]GGX45602.1 mechanosensitive ion channel protein MscS [Tateyamaria omphalii]
MLVTWFRVAVLSVCFALFATFSGAQSNGPDYLEWQSTATRAERAVEAGRASDQAFEILRAEVAGWREQFQNQLTANDSRLQTLRDQIAALGPAPEEGQSEASEIADRREELNAQLERLVTPRRTAEEAFSRANGVITEIDDILRTRQTDALLNMGPWPVNPANWPSAVRHAQNTLAALGAGARQAWHNPSRRANARDNLPLIVVFFIVGSVLLARSRYWTELLATRIQRSNTRSSSDVAGFVVSLGQIILPMFGLFAFVLALSATELFGSRGDLLLELIVVVGLSLFFSRWLAGRLFPKTDAVRAPLAIPQSRRAEGRIYSVLLGLVYGLFIVLTDFSDFDRYDPASDAVLNFPLIVLACLILMRLGWLLRRRVRDTAEDPSQDLPYGDRIVGTIGRVLIVVGFVAPILAAVGFNAAAQFLTYPMILTLALIGTVVLLQGVIRDIYATLKPGEDARDSLVPTLLGFLVVLVSTIPLSLIWGARVTDITEVWATVRSGLTIGDMTISPGNFFTLIIVFTIGYLVTRAVQNALKVSVLPKTRIDPGGQVAIVSGLGYVGIFLAALFAITAAGIDLSSLAIVAGALSVGIGFGLQTIVSNFVSGIILLIERPISEGDWIEVGGQMGYVRSISVRSTRIETFDRTDVIVPNADLISGTVTNYTRGNTVGRVIIPVGVAYGTDTRRVEAVLKEIADAHPMALANPPPAVLFMGFGADSLDFEIRIILRDVNWMLAVKNEINHQIAARFEEEGIEIPFAQRDVWLRNPEVLQAGAKSKTPQPAPPTKAHLDESDMDPETPAEDGDGR